MWRITKLSAIVLYLVFLLWSFVCWVLFFPLFITFFCLSLKLGGSAINGYHDGGRYFLAQHGETTEVSQAVFTRMLALEWMILIAVISCFAGVVLSYSVEKIHDMYADWIGRTHW